MVVRFGMLLVAASGCVVADPNYLGPPDGPSHDSSDNDGNASSIADAATSSTSPSTTAGETEPETSNTSVLPPSSSDDTASTSTAETDTVGPSGCGDGRVGEGEACDDMNDDELDGCLQDCRIGPVGFALVPGDTLDFRGGTLGMEVNEDCPAGEVLIGFRGSADVIVQQLQGVCGTPSLSFSGGFMVQLPETTELPLWGNMETTPFELLCPESEAVVGFAGRAGAFVDQIVVRCAALTVVDDDSSFALEVGAPAPQPPIGGGGGSAFGAQDCGAGQVAAAVDMFTGDFIDQLRLRCASISLTFP